LVSEYTLILTLAGLGVVFAVLPFIIPLIFAPRRANPLKGEPMEAGQAPAAEQRVKLMMQYYGYLLMFVIFDVVGMFFFAWATSFSIVGLTGVLSIVIFLLLLVVPIAVGLKLSGRKDIW
jgi:NADH-quinone oxidoreductase subunit A